VVSVEIYRATPWRRILFENLVKRFPAFYGARSLIDMMTRNSPPPPSPFVPFQNQMSPVHALLYHSFKLRHKIVLPSTSRSSKQEVVCLSFLSHMCVQVGLTFGKQWFVSVEVHVGFSRSTWAFNASYSFFISLPPTPCHLTN
jgi:hypothetical protein